MKVETMMKMKVKTKIINLDRQGVRRRIQFLKIGGIYV